MALSQHNKPNKSFEGFKSLIIWVLLAFLIRWQIIEPRWIPSESMLPTLEVKDRILVEKVTPKINKIFNTNPKREKVVIFYPPDNLINAGYEGSQALIKRIVGIPGDKIEIKNGPLIRNGITIEEPWVVEHIKYDMQEITVPNDSLWVLGDNRNNSLDSHYWGALPIEKLVGTATLRYWPIKRLGPIRFPAT